MKKLFFSMLIVLISQCSYAAAKILHPPATLKVKIDFNYQSELGQNEIHNSINMSTHKPEWIAIAGSYGESQTTDSSSDVHHGHTFILLSKLEKADAEKAGIQFLIIDLNSKSSVISEPKIIVNYGQKGKLSFEKEGRKIQLSVVVNKGAQSI